MLRLEIVFDAQVEGRSVIFGLVGPVLIAGVEPKWLVKKVVRVEEHPQIVVHAIQAIYIQVRYGVVVALETRGQVQGIRIEVGTVVIK